MMTSRQVRLGRQFAVVSILACALLLAPATRAATPDQIDRALENGKRYLYAKQHAGNWEERAKPDANGFPFDETAGQWGGLTAIATYSLLAAGDNPQDPRLAASIDWLKKNADNMRGVYAIAMRSQVWTYLPPKDAKPLLAVEAKLLDKAFIARGPFAGYFGYLVNPGNYYDHSVSQYGVLDAWACAEADVEISHAFWAEVERAWLRDQDRSGGWEYINGAPQILGKPRPSMTAAGVATLFITQDELHAADGVDCHGNLRSPQIDAGVKWLADHFKDVQDNYTWYGIERIGVAGGFKYIGDVDWFHEGADRLVQSQKADGSWETNQLPIADTAFALLFLSRGRAPVAFNKLAYDLAPARGPTGKPLPSATPTPGNWNQRPRDVANAVKFITHQTEHFLNWQVVNLKVPVRELHDAPILYLSGNQPIDLSPDDESKLRQFVEEGGLIVANADCANPAFVNAVLKGSPGKESLAKRLFPNYDARKLPADHPIFTREMFPRDNWKDPVSVTAVSNGSRELLIVFDAGDPARYWQSRAIKGHEAYHQLITDVYLYATDKRDPPTKGHTHLVTPDPTTKPTRALKLARLEYAGNWDPEPAGWRRLAAILHNTANVELDVQPIQLGSAQLDPKTFKFAHLTGTAKLTLTDTQRNELRAYCNTGGTLLIDACGGNGEFAQSAESELDTLFGPDAKSAATPLPPTDPLYTRYGPIPTFAYRTFATRTLGHLDAPRLRAVTKSNRRLAYYSPEDLSTALVGQDVDGILGYTPATATHVVRNLLLTAFPPPPPTTRPATTTSTTQSATTQLAPAPSR